MVLLLLCTLSSFAQNKNITVLFVFGGMLYRVATGDLITVDTSSFLTFLIMNVLCLEFGMKKAMVDKIFKR